MKVMILSLVVVLIFFCSCQKNKDETESVTRKSDEASGMESGLPSFDNDYLVSIYEAQELIKIQQDDVDLRQRYCEKAYLADRKLFISMGIARLHHPETGAAIPDHMVEQAARLDAIRWAAYGKHWLENNYQPAFGKLQANFQQDIKEINRANVGDSLFIFAATTMP